MPNVAFKRKELENLLPLYQLVSDCCEGERAVKNKAQLYLPMPNASDKSPENVARYNAYKTRAVFYNVTKRTLAGLAGFVFLRDPAVTIPAALQPVIDDGTGGGMPLNQLAKATVQYVLSLGRAGVWVDYPTRTPVGDLPVSEGTAGAVATTIAELESGEVRPVIAVYDPRKIINWRTRKKGSKTVLSLVVLEEEYDVESDGFELKKLTQHRVLRLNGAGQYQVEIWRQSVVSAAGQQIPGGVSTMVGEPIVVSGANGQPLDFIPFTFVGVDNNEEQPDYPPLYDLASLNIAHYRNSADYEESCFLVGQPTLIVAGLTKDWVDDVLKGKVALGSRGGIPLPVGGAAELIQAAPNAQPFEAMEHKEKQMVALGAKLVEDREVQRTATEADQQNASETSILASAARNVSTAFQVALGWAGETFMGISGEIKYQLHSDLGLSKMTPEQRTALVSEWQAGAITFEEMREALRQAGIATEDDAQAKEKIATDQAESMQMMTDAGVPTVTPPPDPNKQTA